VSRKKRILKVLGIDDEVDALFGVKPRVKTTAPRRVPSQNSLAVQLNRAAQQPRRALPAPPKQLALPPPDPSKQLPPFAVKPKGGQWFTENSPMPIMAPRQALENAVYMGERFSGDPLDKGLLEWWERAVPRYIQNDLGTPDDPLRQLAERGMLHTDMTPDEWSDAASNAVVPIPLQRLIFDENTRKVLGEDTLAAMPWLNKAPATDSVYGVTSMGLQDLGLRHVADEMRNALRPDVSGLPADLAVRPESLARMSFPQAVERVGRINQFRAKQMEEQAASALNNPAIQTFKEYPDAGYRWVELRAPDTPDIVDYGGDVGIEAYTRARDAGGDALGKFRAERARTALQDALKFEGDTMGHCVGGYCDDVMSGRSRIYSLRDAKGQPHVTIETGKGDRNGAVLRHMRELGVYDDWVKYSNSNRDWSADPHDEAAKFLQERGLPLASYDGEDIIQIKGKQNRAPTDDYLPYVQDFVKSGTWGNIGDFNNTGLVKLPDGRYITQQQMAEGMARARTELPPEADPGSMITFNWNGLSPFFEGYAVGGRVDRNRCFSRHPMSVR